MSGSHKEFPKKAVAIQLGLAALVGIGFLFADKSAVHATAEKITKPIVAAAQKVLAPIGKVEVKEEKAGAAARSGEEVYAGGCGTCHDNGVAGAPKLDDKATWENRLSGGFTALVASAINGKGGMPARGGNPDNTDSEMELAVSHMIKKAGIELVAKSASNNAAAPAKAEEMKPATAEVKTEEDPKAEEAMKKEEAPKAEETTIAKEAAPKAEEAVKEMKIEAEEKTAEVMEKKDETMANAEDAMAKTEEVKTDAVAAVASTAAATAVVDHAKGEAVYKSSCFACHNTGVAGSPKLGDKEGWASRIAAGADSMYNAAINGKGAMPAKGGNASISDEDIKAAVDYMAAQAQ